jgi:putative transposase
MLRSYTRAINIQEKRSGSLFRERTKAIWLGSIESEKLKFQSHNKVKPTAIPDSNKEYLHSCFKYIHENPVKAGLVQKNAEWEFSSARDFEEKLSKSLINKKLGEEMGLIMNG